MQTQTDNSEAVFQTKMLDFLSSDFKILKEQAVGYIRDNRVFIDAIIEPIDKSLWKNKNVKFGIEFKSIEKIKQQKQINQFIAQCVSYSFTDFKGYDNLLIAACPSSYSKLYRATQDRQYHWSNEYGIAGRMHRFLGAFGVAEFVSEAGVVKLILNTNVIWEKSGKEEKGKFIKSTVERLNMNKYFGRRK